MASLKSSLKEAVRRLAFSTSVDQLKKRGVKNVNVVGLDRIVQLIEEAVHRSLKNRLLVGDRMAVADATKEEFLRLLRTNEELQQHKARADEEAESLRLELTRLRQDLAAKLAMAEASQQADYVKQDEAIRDLIGAALQEAGGGEGLEARVLELVMHVVQSERRVSEAAQEAARDRDVSLLQRRIEKLSASLESTEKQLREVSSRKEVESGIASVYREVQGLSEADNQFGKKKELMAGIFAANLQLQKKS